MHKKHTSRWLAIVGVALLLSLLAAPLASPARAAGNPFALLLSAVSINGKLVFRVEVHGSANSYSGSALINGDLLALRCHEIYSMGSLKNDNLFVSLACSADEGGRPYIGQLAQVTVGGLLAGADVVVAADTTQYCASVFDIDNSIGGGGGAEIPAPVEIWTIAGTYCQDSPFSPGQIINWYNPAYDAFYDYTYSLDGQDMICTFPPNMGPGFYWDYQSCAY